MNINVLIIIVLLILSFIGGYFFGKSKTKEKNMKIKDVYIVSF
jgi:uncharacterized protein YneF (UPF0154 family)